MHFISYAQNFEDIMLWKALKHVQDGFYIDIGAQHPVLHSVSKAFYMQGWRGIHVEPVAQFAELLRQDRPDEIVLEVAIADFNGILDFNVIPDTGLSTAVPYHAQQYFDNTGNPSQKIQIPALTLDSALRDLVKKNIHWMKIDVEGLEEQVLKGWNSVVIRPWIIVIEATLPNSPTLSYENWEPLLINADYVFAYFDGLNRFYVAKEHRALRECFATPLNVFDNDCQLSEHSPFCSTLVASYHQHIHQLSAALSVEKSLVQAQQHALEDAQKNIEKLREMSHKGSPSRIRQWLWPFKNKSLYDTNTRQH